MMIKAAVIGATGYAGVELIRLLHNHPKANINALISHSSQGKNISEIYPQFRGILDFRLEEFNINNLKDCDVVFTALPHGVSQDTVAELYKENLKIIDLSGDYRYRDTKIYENWYAQEHKHPDLAKKFVYGLADVYQEEIKNARLISNPGCYPTASLLGLLPIARAGLMGREIIIDAKSGVTGAGSTVKKPFIFNEIDEDIKAYKINEHRHTSEIENILNLNFNNDSNNFDNNNKSNSDLNLTFTPHLIPVKRGILSTMYVNLTEELSQEVLISIYQDMYDKSDFVQILTDSVPRTKYLCGSNYCHMSLKLDERTGRVVIVSAIDNLMKGAAGQAVQNMNLSFGLDEKMGLEGSALVP